MASDYDFLPVSNGSGDAALMHITGTRIVGATTIAVDSVTNVPTKFVATYGTLLATGYLDPSTKGDFKGHVSGGSLVIDAFEPGTTDTGNTSSQVVIIKPNTGWSNRVAQFIKNATNLGTPEAMTASTLTVSTGTTLPAGDIGTADIAGGAITFAKLLSTIFSGQITSYSNAGSAGGTFNYVNLGGIKLLWGVTGTVSISGSGPLQSGAVNITLPGSFFTTLTTVMTSIGSPPSGTSALSATFQGVTGTSNVAVVLNQIVGTNGSAGISVLIIGT